jgi:superfamily I DNA/RNA helicase
MDTGNITSEFMEGQMVLCRTNAPLVRTAYMLWGEKRRAYIQGRKLADPLLRTLKEYTGIYGENASTLDFRGWLEDYAREHHARLLRDNASNGAITELEDRVGCLSTLAMQCNTVAALNADIDRLFSDGKDPKTNVRLSSVHRAKGLESDVVWVLEPDLMPHPRATLDWEKGQERNIAYVAATRAIKSLRFVGTVPAIFGDRGEQE